MHFFIDPYMLDKIWEYVWIIWPNILRNTLVWRSHKGSKTSINIHSSVCLFIFFAFVFSFIFISWRLITLQYCSSFCHTLTWISHGFTCVPHPDPPPASLPIPSLWVFPVHQPWAPVSCIQPGLVICFTLDSILVSMLFSQNIPPSPSPTESQPGFTLPCSKIVGGNAILWFRNILKSKPSYFVK